MFEKIINILLMVVTFITLFFYPIHYADLACENKGVGFTFDMEYAFLGDRGAVVCENGEIAHWDETLVCSTNKFGNEDCSRSIYYW